jgi:hypothetical protein
MREFRPVPKPEKGSSKTRLEYRLNSDKKIPFRRIKKISNKQAAMLQEYAQVRKAFLAEHLYCEANLTGCLTVASQVHHKQGRGANLSNVETFLAVCGVCHRYIEDNPTEALKMGFSKSRLHD